MVFLACPLSMGVMMWMMMRGGGHRQVPGTPDRRIAELEVEIRELRAQQDSAETPRVTASRR